MKFLAFLAVVLLSGAIAGTAQGVANLVLVEPVLDKAIYLENKALFDSGAEQDSIEFRVAHEEYRVWQKGGQLVSSAILGMSMGSLFGLVFGYARKSLPSSNILKLFSVHVGILMHSKNPRLTILKLQSTQRIMSPSQIRCLNLQRWGDLMDISQME